MVWLTLAWKFLRAIPLKTWLLLAFLAAVLACLAYAHRHGTLTERAAQEAKLAAMIRRGTEAMAEKDRRNAIAQATAFANGQAIGESRARDQRDNLAAKDRLIADLRYGNRRLQDRWQHCLSGPQAGDAADLSGGPVRADELRREIAEEISEGFDADSRHARLVEFVQVQQRLCEAVAGP